MRRRLTFCERERETALGIGRGRGKSGEQNAMPLSKRSSEFTTIDALRRIFGEKRVAGLELGIGDDAAVVRSRGSLAWTIDTSVEGVHFERRWLTFEQIGFRSFQAAASDLCAMGGQPRFALSS